MRNVWGERAWLGPGGGWIREKLESEGWCRLQRDWWRDVVVRLVDSEKEK